MMKKTTQTLVLTFGTLLLLVSVTVCAQAQPAQDRIRGDAPNFAGMWNAITSKGKTVLISLHYDRTDSSVVTGDFIPPDGLTASYRPSDSSINEFVKVSLSTAGPVPQTAGSIRGTLTDNVLRFNWVQDRGHGAGRLTLSSDGESFEGTFSATNNPDDTSGGTLNGTRVYSFAGAWQGKLGESFVELILQQSGDQVTGEINLNSVHFLIVDGIVQRNSLRFTVMRTKTMGKPEQVGTGELVMERRGKSFTGTVLGAATSGTLVGRPSRR